MTTTTQPPRSGASSLPLLAQAPLPRSIGQAAGGDAVPQGLPGSPDHGAAERAAGERPGGRALLGDTAGTGPRLASARSRSTLTPAGGRQRNLSPEEQEALVRAVAAEARGEKPEVWKAVAQTIINYAEKHGKRIEQVTRSSYLSSNRDHNRKYYTMPLHRIPNAAGITDAVQGAARGESPIGNRTHFHDTRIGTPAWGNRASRMQIGRMVFLKEKGER